MPFESTWSIDGGPALIFIGGEGVNVDAEAGDEDPDDFGELDDESHAQSMISKAPVMTAFKPDRIGVFCEWRLSMDRVI